MGKEKSDYLDKYDKLLSLITDIVEIDGKMYDLKEDFDKFYTTDNKTAGTRMRRVMQEIKKVAQDIRKDVQEYKKDI